MMTYHDGLNLMLDLYNKTDNYWYLYLLWVVATLGWVAAPTPRINAKHRLLVALTFWVVSFMDMSGLLISYSMMAATKKIMDQIQAPWDSFALRLDPGLGFWLTVLVQVPVGIFITWAIWNPKWVEALVPQKAK